MASEITVQTIKGPTSGANANKVIIPSGQTLDASNGFVAPSGHVIGVAHAVSPAITVNSTGETLIVSVSYTAKVTGSRLLVSGISPRYTNNSSTGTWQSSAYLHLKQGSIPKASFEHVGTSVHSGEACENVPVEYYSDAVTAGTTYTFGLYHQPTNGGVSNWYFGRNHTFSGGTTQTHTRITVQEISQ